MEQLQMMAFPLAHCLLCVHLKFMNLENSYLNMHFHFHTMLPVTTGKNKGKKHMKYCTSTDLVLGRNLYVIVTCVDVS